MTIKKFIVTVAYPSGDIVSASDVEAAISDFCDPVPVGIEVAELLDDELNNSSVQR